MRNYILALSILACISEGCAPGYVATRPPDLRYARAVSPGPDYVWTSGEWNYRNGKYHWKEGSWQRPKPGKSWKSGFWEKNTRGYIWHKGHWQ